MGKYLYLEGANITELLRNLSVEGYLNLDSTQIDKILTNLLVGGKFRLYFKKLKKTYLLDNDCKKLKDFLNKISRNNCHKETTNTLPPSRTLLFLIAAELFDAEKNYRQNLPAAEVNIANAIIRLLEVANFLEIEIEIEIDITGTYSRSITLGYENPYDMLFRLIPRIFALEAFIDHIKRRRKKSTLNKLRNVGPAFGETIYELFKLGQALNLDVKTAILEISNLPHSS